MKILKNECIKPFSSMKVGGKCDLIFFPENIGEILYIMDIYEDVLVLGNMTNVIVPDKGIRRPIMMLRDNFNEISVDGNLLTADAGASLRKLSQSALQNSLSGLEFLDGIPGSVGGAVWMNAGAYGSEIKDVIHSVEVLRRGRHLNIPAQEIEFSKRFSEFQKTEDIILGATFEGIRGEYEEINAKIKDFNGRRKDKQPLNYPSCGSVFKRPENGYASAMIDESGLKGLRVGGAEVSTKHAGFIINVDNASSQDVTNLIELVRDKIVEKYGIRLETEIQILEN